MSYLLFGNPSMGMLPTIISVFLALTVTILLLIFIFPNKRGEKFSGFLKAIHNYFQFKTLWIDKILKAAFMFATCYAVFSGIITGFIMMIDAIDYGSSSYMGTAIGYILGSVILAPIIIRLIYEGLMMFVLLVTNVIEINKKLSGPSKEVPTPEVFSKMSEVTTYAPPAPAAPISTPIDLNAPLFNPNKPADAPATGSSGLRSTFKTDNNN